MSCAAERPAGSAARTAIMAIFRMSESPGREVQSRRHGSLGYQSQQEVLIGICNCFPAIPFAHAPDIFLRVRRVTDKRQLQIGCSLFECLPHFKGMILGLHSADV